jgi:glycosyltransferase involved in cell wall biosynthesis
MFAAVETEAGSHILNVETRASFEAEVPLSVEAALRVRQQQPLVSVLIPWYYGENWREQLENTLVRQTYPHWEAIVVADGCHAPEFNDPRFKVFKVSHGGISHAQNKAFELSKGSFITLLDQDDCYDPQCLEILLTVLFERTDLGYVTSAQKIKTPDFTHRQVCEGWGRQTELEGHYLGHAIMVRRDCWVPFDSTYDPTQDTDWSLRLQDNVAGIYLPKTLYTWNLYNTNTSIRKHKEQQSLYIKACKVTKERRERNPNICFVLPGIGRAGGIRVVLELAVQLKRRGWKVAICDSRTQAGVSIKKSLGRAYHTKAIPNTTPMIDLEGIPVWDAIPQNTDLAVATSWDESVRKVLEHTNNKHGAAGWLIQDWEFGWGPDYITEKPDIPYKVTTARWVQRSIEKKWQEKIPWLPYGTSYFCGRSGVKPLRPKVLMSYRNEWRKNPEGTLALARYLIAKGLEVKIMTAREEYSKLSGLEDYAVYDLANEEVFQAFQESTHFVTRSRQEGLYLMSLEAMSQGCIPICQDIGTEHITNKCGRRLGSEATEEDYFKAILNTWWDWSNLSFNAMRIADKYSWPIIIERWDHLFKSWLKDYHAGIKNIYAEE